MMVHTMNPRPFAVCAVTLLVLTGCQVSPPPPTEPLGATVSYASGASTHGVVAVDFDGDGRVDLIVTVAGEDAVIVLRGLGDRAFARPVRLETGPFPKHAAVADLNGNGLLDIVTANQDGNDGDGITVLLRLPSGGFAAANYAACANPHHVAVGRFGSQGRVDVAVACWGQSEIAVLPGLGDGSFGAPQFHLSGASPHALVVEDLDGDGFDDIAIANLGGSTVAVLRGLGSYAFDAAVTYPVGARPHGIALGDLDGDGVPDLVTANESGTVSVLMGVGDGTFTVTDFPAGSVPKDVAVGDIDGDGVPDIVTANSHGNYPNGSAPTDVSLLRGAGDGTFGAPTRFRVDLSPFAVDVADLDGDGRLDVVTANWHSGDVVALYNTGGGQLGEADPVP